ncbi:GMP synthase [glutamine-hydrolyzing] [Thelohanellus kitauei]|uniref:GMP synthase (glutamine-hydrolyzing) n=1 Tax=Thelohanellus kitauei TaxID=669202 RepID=A0A0C2NEA5_THEKT|nr:GMP synthase [glutamine-hydrolyzing] [Thelohanellus kitauei]
MEKELDVVLIIGTSLNSSRTVRKIITDLCVQSDSADIYIPSHEIRKQGFKAIIITGDALHPLSEEDKIRFDEDILELGIPILGICTGMELIVSCLGGTVVREQIDEPRISAINIETPCRLYQGLKNVQKVCMTSSIRFEMIPDYLDINTEARTEIASISCEDDELYAVLFQPELPGTENGIEIFKNFLFEIANIKPNYTMDFRISMIERTMKRVKPKDTVICLVSGGLDSTVCAVMVNKTLKNTKYFLLIDHGFLRQDEAVKVRRSLGEFGIDVIVMDETHRFLNSSTFIKPYINYRLLEETDTLKNTQIADCKRQIIGNVFVNVLQRFLSEKGIDIQDVMLVNGTLKLDFDESGSSSMCEVKEFHSFSYNFKLLRQSRKLLEPLKFFYKDEVRKIAFHIGLPESIYNCASFPGPGLAIRVICQEEAEYKVQDGPSDDEAFAEFVANFKSRSSSDEKYARIIKKILTPAEFDSLMKATDENYKIRAFLIPVLTTSFHNGYRSVKNCVVFSSNHTKIRWSSFEIISKIISKYSNGVNRVVYAFGPEIIFPVKAVTITGLTPRPIELVRKAQKIVDDIMEKEKLKIISIFAVILIPIQFDLPDCMGLPFLQHSLVLRPFITDDFVIGVPALPGRDFDEAIIHQISDEVSSLPGISRVLYDLTPKPPATIEWE